MPRGKKDQLPSAPEGAVLLSVNQAASLLGVHPNTVWNMLQRGELERIKGRERCGRQYRSVTRVRRREAEEIKAAWNKWDSQRAAEEEAIRELTGGAS